MQWRIHTSIDPRCFLSSLFGNGRSNILFQGNNSCIWLWPSSLCQVDNLKYKGMDVPLGWASVSQDPVEGVVPQDPPLQGIWQPEPQINEDAGRSQNPSLHSGKRPKHTLHSCQPLGICYLIESVESPFPHPCEQGVAPGGIWKCHLHRCSPGPNCLAPQPPSGVGTPSCQRLPFLLWCVRIMTSPTWPSYCAYQTLVSTF